MPSQILKSVKYAAPDSISVNCCIDGIGKSYKSLSKRLESTVKSKVLTNELIDKIKDDNFLYYQSERNLLKINAAINHILLSCQNKKSSEYTRALSIFDAVCQKSNSMRIAW